MPSLGYQSSSDDEYVLAPSPEGGVALSLDKKTVLENVLVAESETMRPRSYQVEMFEESMKRNIVVTMDTGSGKTHIAVLRIDAELSRCDPEKLIWFLAPTVSLCQQQSNEIRRQLPAVPVCFLSGADNVVRWSDQSIWNAVLNGVSVVVSTHQVLYDALTHGFVKMGRLSLLIFDEAHHCVESHPANRIMQEYHRELRNEGPKAVPHILGMSASPVVKSKPGGLQILEQNLNAISKTPRIQREELMKYVHPPLLEKLVYPAAAPPEGLCPAYNSLLGIYQHLDIMNDPYVVLLMNSAKDERQLQNLQKIIRERKTYCENQIKGICIRSCHIFEELGLWATNYYIVNSIARLRSSRQDDEILGWNGEEKKYLLEKLGQVQMPSEGDLEPEVLERPGQVSPKLKRLIGLLVRESVPQFAGLVFVQQRAAAAVLSQLLSVHPQTRHRFDCATFVGTSSHLFRKAGAIGDLIEPHLQKDTLDDFRNGRKNLVIATSVLEEGIDVSACHIVICYEKPPNLKSFVQRRGRARARQSKYVIMLANTDVSAAVTRWQDLEEEMIRIYMDDKRKLDKISEMESLDEFGHREYRITSTGAFLTLENAKSHLHHFCATLPKSQYVDMKPEFTIIEDPQTELLSAVVTLPNCVHPSVRQAAGIKQWRTERMALKDAAFEMYLKLYRAKLVNDHLLPLRADDRDDDMKVAVEKRPSIVDVSGQLNPWVAVARQWSEFNSNLFVSVVEIDDGMNGPVQMNLFLPVHPPCTPEFTLFWNETVQFRASIKEAARASPKLSEDLNKLRDMTHLLLMSVFSSRMTSKERDYPVLFYPAEGPGDQVSRWSGAWPASEIPLRQTPHFEYGIVRDTSQSSMAYIYKGPCSDDGGIDELCLFARRLPKRRDFLHVVAEVKKDSDNVSQPKTEDFLKQEKILAQNCVIDNLPFRYAQFALFIPSILHHVEISLVANELRNTILAPVVIQDLGLVTTAISASVAREATNYQRLEFLGDSILKLCTSVQVIAEHQTWHEGYLSAKKDRTVANSRLARSAREIGLDKFILTKGFTGQKWRPFHIFGLLKDQDCDAKRGMSTKVLADVVEALIGASFMDGGFEKAVKCLRVFLPEIRWESLPTSNSFLYTAAKLEIPVPAHFSDLERLIGYQFSKPSLLLEAMMHATFQAQSAAVSYQRLEFLGDSVLDYIVVSNLFLPEKGPKKELSHIILHLARTALVNADFLAFLCMEAAVDVARPDIIEAKEKEDFGKIEKRVPVQLWKFMRHHSPAVAQAQAACMRRYEMLKDDIRKGLDEENGYPWAKLAQLEADKFFSDLVESMIGAVYVDSGGSFKTCEKVLEKLGFFRYLRRILNGEVDLWHPKERLGQLADQGRVEYVIGIHGKEQGEAGDKREYWCRVLIEGKEIVLVGGGTNRVEVKTRAAEVAVRLLKEQKERDKDVVMEGDEVIGKATEEVEDGIMEDIAEEELDDVMTEEDSYSMPGSFV